MLGAGSEFTSSEASVSFYQISDGKFLQAYLQETGYGVRALAFSPDGRLFAYGRVDATVVVARNPFAASLHLINTAPSAIAANESCRRKTSATVTALRTCDDLRLVRRQVFT
jgi:hypothetical protein